MAITISTTFTVEGAQAVTTATTQATSAIKGLQDRLAQAERASTQSTQAMISGLRALSQQGTVTATGQGALGKALLQTGQAAGATTTQLKVLKQQYDEVEKASKGVSASHLSMLSSLKSLAAGFGVMLSVQGLVGFTKSIIEAGIAQDRLMLSLKGALGSAQAAGEAYAFVEGVANRLGIGLLTAGESFAKLSAATQGTVVQGQQTRDLFVAISEASRVMGLSTSEVGGVVTALTQIIGKNTVSMEELRQQLGERLPSVLRLTAKEMGFTTSKFIEMVSKGEVLATDFIPAVTRAMQQMGREAPAAAASVQAALERMGNAWFALKVAIANSGVLDAVSKIGEEIARVLNFYTNLINRTARMAGEMGLAPMVDEMQRLTAQIQRNKEITDKADLAGPFSEQAQHIRNTTTALEAQRDALAIQIEAKRKIVEQDEKGRNAANALAEQDIKNASAKEAEMKALTKASEGWTKYDDDLKDVAKSLAALRSFDVESLQALRIDPFAADFEKQWTQAEAFLLKKQKELLDKRAGLDKGDAARAIREAGESVVARAKAVEEALAKQLKREESMIAASADTRRRAIDEAASAALTAEGPGNVEAIAAQRMHDLQAVATQVAAELETLRLDTLAKQAQARETTLKAEIAAAGKNLSAAAAAQEELKNLTAATEQERAEIIKKRADADQKTSKQSADEQIKNARDVNKILKEVEDDRLKARIDLVDEQIALIEAQVQGEVLTTEEGQAQIQRLYQNRFADIRLLYESQAQAQIDAVNQEVQATLAGTEARVQAEAMAVGQIEKIRQGLATQLEAVNLKQQTETQRFLNHEHEQYERFVDKVSSGLASIFEGLLSGTLNLLESFKKLFLRTLSTIIAEAASRAIIVPIITQVIGAVGSFAPGVAGAVSQAIGLGGAALGVGGGGGGGTGGGGLLDTGGTALTGIGLTRQLTSLFGVDSPLSSGLSFLTDTVTSAGQALVNWVNAVKFGTSVSVESAIQTSAAMDAAIPGTTAAGPGTGAGAATLGQIGTIAGGLAALGGGIYAALNASNNAAKAAYAASAAAGAFAAGATATGVFAGAAAGTAVGAGWTGVGLIAAAALAVVGVVLDRVLKPAGPNLAVGRPQGLNIGTADGKLQVQGDLGSRVIRKEGVDPAMARGVQAQLEAGLTSAVISIVDTINAVALDPAALVGPTQEALQKALSNIKTINSGSLKRMERDISEQLRFANIAIVGGLLEPVNLALDQLRDTADVQTQIARLPASVQGLLSIFKTMNQQLNEMAKSENTDVLRQISGVRNQVENFGNRIAGTAAQTAESIVNNIIDQLSQPAAPASLADAFAISPTEKLPSTTTALDRFDKLLADQITDLYTRMNKAFGAVGSLRATQRSLEEAGLPGGGVAAQIDRLAKAMSEGATRISTELVSTALGGLAAQLDQVLIQPIKLQATTINALFTGSMAALQTLWNTWHNLEGAGIDASGVQEQFTRLLGGMLDSVTQVLDTAFQTGSFSEFLAVLASVPPALAAMNPELQKLQQIGATFAQVVNPVAQAAEGLRDTLRTVPERLTESATRITDLRSAIADAGNSAERALPLYAQLSQAILNNANLQIQMIQAIAQAWESAMNQVQADMDAIAEEFGSFGQQIGRAFTHLADDANDFYAAVNAGDVEAAITAIQSYAQGLVNLANLQIKQIQAERQAVIDAQQAVIDAWQAGIDAQQAVIEVWQDSIDVQEKVIQTWQDAIRVQEDYIGTLRDEVQARQKAVDTLKQQIDSLKQISDRAGGTVRQIAAPPEALRAIRTDISATEGRLATAATTDDALKELERLVSLNEELKQLGEQTNRLDLIKEAMDNLVALQEKIDQALPSMEAQLSIDQQQLDAATQTLTAAENQLKVMQNQLAVEQQYLEALQAQREIQQTHLQALQAQLEVEHRQLAAIEKSTYWDEQIALIQIQLYNQLEAIKQWLIAVQGPTTWEDQIKAIQQATLAKLEQMELDLQQLFLAAVQSAGAAGISVAIQQEMAARLRMLNEYNLALPLKTVVQNFYDAPKQHGGIVGYASGMYYAQGGMTPALNVVQSRDMLAHTYAQGGMVPVKPSMAAVDRIYDSLHVPHQKFAQGGMVPVRLEPGERVYEPPMSRAQQGALVAMNAAFPRQAGGWTVPGYGSGDTVHAWVPPGSFVLNRNAAGTQGRQDGGPVQGGISKPEGKGDTHIHNHFTFSNNHFRSKEDAHEIIKILQKHMRDNYRSDMR